MPGWPSTSKGRHVRPWRRSMWGAAEKCKLKSKKCKVRSEKCTHLPSSTFRTSSVILSLGKCWRFWEVKMFSLWTEPCVHRQAGQSPLQTSSLAKLTSHFMSHCTQPNFAFLGRFHRFIYFLVGKYIGGWPRVNFHFRTFSGFVHFLHFWGFTGHLGGFGSATTV